MAAKTMADGPTPYSLESGEITQKKTRGVLQGAASKRATDREYYPEAWYPVCLSKEIRRGQVRRLEAFDSQIVIFRTESGQVGVVSRYCPHMGTDLTRAAVVDEQLRCPFHHRAFDSSGRLKEVPGASRMPRNCDLGTMPVTERFGLVFIFLGEKPSFDFPPFSRVTGEAAYSACETKTMRTPYHALLFNGFDTHHLGCIHNREVREPPVLFNNNVYHYGAEFTMHVAVEKFYDVLIKWSGADVSPVRLDCWGGNFVVITNERTKDNVMIASYPMNRNLSRVFLVAVTEQESGSWLRRMLQRVRLRLTAYLGMAFLKPDEDIIEDMRPDIKKLSAELDQGVIQFWRYWEKLPRDRSIHHRVLVSD